MIRKIAELFNQQEAETFIKINEVENQKVEYYNRVKKEVESRLSEVQKNHELKLRQKNA